MHPAASGPPAPRSSARQPVQVEVREPSSTPAATEKNPYFESGALDRIAEPVGEWALDTSLLPLTGESTFQISIWISARGDIEKWEVKSLSLDEDLTTAIFARLNDTVMNPGRVGDKPVASVLRFELSAERQ